MVPTSVGLVVTFGQYDMVLPPYLIPRDTVRGVASLATVPQQQLQSQIHSQLYANYAVGPPEVCLVF